MTSRHLAGAVLGTFGGNDAVEVNPRRETKAAVGVRIQLQHGYAAHVSHLTEVHGNARGDIEFVTC